MTSFAGINREMKPYLSMSAPLGIKNIDDVEIELDKTLFRSAIKLFGIIPIDYSDLKFIKFETGVGFVEQSNMGSMRLWKHDRRIAKSSAGCTLVDTLTFEPKIFGAVLNMAVRAFFSHRHTKLRAHLN